MGLVLNALRSATAYQAAQLQLLSPLLLAQPSTYPGGSSPRICGRHTRMIVGRLRE